jgi:hypothetical protein
MSGMLPVQNLNIPL